ncbi:MAG: Hsp20/alpha crystallin family protein [Pseudomonadales bacterium]|jgi:HSP20 family protein|nr:Hsp20/alpha crystallin family protein [Pseudomonadales bacterium]MCP5336683.1 Hsp20/alpha crystallin family protein [Pseudomonadales bacterium]
MFTYLTNGERSLFDEFERLQQEMDQLFSVRPRGAIRGGRIGAFPQINIGATEDEVHVYVYAPGFEASQFDVTIQQNVLSLGGHRAPEPREQRSWYLRERFDGEFRRAVTLPEDIDPEHVEASYRNGVLHLAIKRRAAVRPRQIPIA